MGVLDTSMIVSKDGNMKIIISNISELSFDDKDFIIENLVEISKGRDSYYKNEVIAQKILNFLHSQSLQNQHGAIAEFFLVCILRSHDFNQEYCFRNLEENSVKKGFDGLFEKNNEIWIAESKSSYTDTTHKYRHKNTIDKAYNGLTEQLSGKTRNDPWENAVTHAKVSGSNDSLIQNLTNLSLDYSEEKFTKIESLKIIIGSTIFTEDIKLIETNLTQLESYLEKHEAKEELLVTINLQDANILIDLLNEESNND